LLRLPRRRGSRWRGLHKRGLRSEHLHERLIGALFIRVSAAHSYRADQLILHDDRQTAGDEVIGEALGLAEVQTNQAAVDGVKSLRDRSR